MKKVTVFLAVLVVLAMASVTMAATETKLFEGKIVNVTEKTSAKGNPMVIIEILTEIEEFGMEYEAPVSIFAFNANIEKANKVKKGENYKIIYTRADDGFCVYRHHVSK